MSTGHPFLAIIVLLAFAAPSPSTEPQQARLPAVIKAWTDRQKRTRSARFLWTETVTRTKGSLLGPKSPQVVAGRAPVLPQEDIVQDFQRELVFDGDKIAYRIDGEFWAHEHGTFQHQRYASASNGKTSKTYWPPDTRYPMGILDASSKHLDLTSYHIKPLLMTYR